MSSTAYKIKEKEYEFKYPSILLVKQADALAKKSNHLQNIQELLSVDTDKPEWAEAVAQWKSFCDLIFVTPDEGLELGNISPRDLTEIPKSFFLLGLAGQLEQRSS